MRFTRMAAAALLAMPALALAGREYQAATPVPWKASEVRLPLLFERNAGQAAPAVEYLARTRGGIVFLTDEEAVLSLKCRQGGAPAVLRMRPVGAAAGSLSGGTASSTRVNHFVGSRSAWRTNIPTFHSVRRAGVYPGVDLVYHGREGALEYDFEVAPGSDPAAIALEISGTSAARVDRSGRLRLQVTGGELIQEPPVAFQETPQGRRSVPAAFRLLSRDRARGTVRIAFQLGEYDRTRHLVIDPIIWYSTFVGGNSLDSANAVAVQPDGTTLIAGETLSTNFPANPSFQGDRPGHDAFVMKLNATANWSETPTIAYATYLGSSGEDFALCVDVDANGNAAVGGSVGGFDFPVQNAFQPVFGDGSVEFPSDGFVTVLDTTGTALLYSSYLGGTGNDQVNGIVFNTANQVAVTGWTFSANFPTKGLNGGAIFQGDQPGRDAFVSRFRVDLAGANSLLNSTYLGGGGDDQGRGIAADDLGDLYVVGDTTSRNFPTTAGSFRATDPDPIAATNSRDGFVTRILQSTGALGYSTYLGGTAEDIATSVAVTPAREAVVAGSTKSSNFPRRFAVDGTFAVEEAFVASLNTAGNQLRFSTFLGGAAADGATGIALDPNDPATMWVTGRTLSNDFPLAAPLFSTRRGGVDAFVAQLVFIPAFEGQQLFLIHSTYLGGMNDDIGLGIAVDGSSLPYVVGRTASGGRLPFPRMNALQLFGGGTTDGFITKFGEVFEVQGSAGRIVTAPAKVDFGTVRRKQTRRRVVRIRNTGTEPLRGVVGNVDAPFSVTSGVGDFALQPGETHTVELTFRANKRGVSRGVLSIVSSDLNRVRRNIRLQARGR